MPRDATELSLLEQHAMLALIRRHPRGYGVSVQEDIESITGKTYSFGSIYAALDRLKDRGFVSAQEGESIPERGGRRKVFFTVTVPGRRALDASISATDRLRDGIALGEFA